MKLTSKQKKVFNYFKSSIKNVSKDNESILKFFFPESDIYYENLPSFLREDVPVILILKTKDKTKDMLLTMIPNLLIFNISTKNIINSKKGFYDIIVTGLGLNVREDLDKALNGLTELEYWETLKYWYFSNKIVPFQISDKQVKSPHGFNLFKSLFTKPYSELYSHYTESKEPYHKIFSSILTMMTTCKNVDSQEGLNIFYKNILLGHKRYLPVFKKALVNYTQTNITEDNFLTFLYECSSDSKIKF